MTVSDPVLCPAGSRPTRSRAPSAKAAGPLTATPAPAGALRRNSPAGVSALGRRSLGAGLPPGAELPLGRGSLWGRGSLQGRSFPWGAAPSGVGLPGGGGRGVRVQRGLEEPSSLAPEACGR